MASTIRFIKVITRTSLEDGKFRFPNSFTKIHGDHMPNSLFLKPPDGKEWKVNWNKHEGDIWLQKSWEEFAKYYSLAHGYMVLFEYKETSHFGVQIFNKSTLEIKYPFHHGSQEEQNNLNQISEEDSVEILDEPLPCKKTSRTRLKSQSPCPQPLTKKLRSFELQNLPTHEETDGSTEDLRRATSFRSTNPFFKFVMPPSYLYNPYLHIPSQFAKKYLKKQESDILLQIMDGTTWHAKCCIGRIQGGWKKFVSDNNLKLGDVCVFELTNSQTLTLKITTFRVEEEPRFLPPQGGKATLRASLWTNPHSFANEALEEANKYTSENPFFVVDIKPNQLGDYRPFIPNAFARKYLDKKEIVSLKFGKKSWLVKLYHYSLHCNAVQNRVKLSGGWQLFSRESKLQGGDVCVFELFNNEDVVLHVHIY